MQIDKNLKNKSGIYRLTIKNHVYIGSSINLYKRLLTHFNELQKNKHENQYLQRCVNKYGIDSLTYTILAIAPNATKPLLLALEKFFIDFEKADLNLKMDPRTEENCKTTTVPVYQFNKFGEMEQRWESESEAARHFNIDTSNIAVCCNNPTRQKFAAGHLWSYCSEYPYAVEILYVFDLDGNYLGRYADTSEIADLFPDVQRKTILSQLRKKIDSNIPYKNIYISTNRDFKIPENYVPKYRESDQLDTLFSTNPLIYVYDASNKLLYTKPLFSFEDVAYVKRKIRKGSTAYRLQKDAVLFNQGKTIEVVVNGEIKFYKSAVEASYDLFGDISHAKNICKHIQRKTPYRNYYFERVL